MKLLLVLGSGLTQYPWLQVSPDPSGQSASRVHTTVPGVSNEIEPSVMVFVKLPPIIVESVMAPEAARATVTAVTCWVPAASPYECAQITEPSTPESSAVKASSAVLLFAVKPRAPRLPSYAPPMNTLPVDDTPTALAA